MVRLRTLIMVILKPSFLPTCIWLDQLRWDCLGEMSKQTKYVYMFAELPSFVSSACVFAFFLVHKAFVRDLCKYEYGVRWGVKFTAMNFCD